MRRGRTNELAGSSIALYKALLLAVAVAVVSVLASCSSSGGNDNPVTVIATPSAVNLGTNLDSTTVSLSSSVATPPSVSGIGASDSWLNASADTVDGNGLGSYTVSVDRAGLPGGDYRGTVIFTLSNGNSVVLVVAMRVAFTISGTITAASNTAVDGDLNDPFSPLTRNDTFVTAQPLATPVIVNGFATLSGTGFPGDRFRTSGDEFDVYSAHLLAGQFVSLRVADFPLNPANDLDVQLWDSTGTILEAESNGTTEFESVQVTTDGDYFIRVEAIAGSSKYVLNIGSTSLAPAAAAGIPANFVPDQVIVKYRPQSASSTNTALKLTPGVHLSRYDRARPVLLRRDRTANNAAIMNALGAASAGASPARQTFEAALPDESRRKLETLRLIKQLNANPDIEYAEPNYIRQALFTPNDRYYPFQLHYPQIRLPAAWDITTGASSVIVAVVDTGVFLAHEDLAGQLVPGFDFISDVINANDGNGIDPDPDDPGDGTIGASSWHGTHVSGTIAAASNNGTGVAGIAPGARIMPLRVLGKLGGTSHDIDQALRFAAGLANDSNTVPAMPADIINLSLGGPGFSQTEQNLFNELHNQGIIVVAAAGNENASVPSYPAAYNNVVSVSALDYQNQRAPYSNFGPTVDVAAPGGDASVDRDGNGYPDGILSTLVDDTTGTRANSYAFYQGTSMAAPHVAGVAALMKSVNPGLTASGFDALLINGDLTIDAGDTGRDDIYGYGIIDALKAVQVANGGIIPGTVLASPTFINLGTTLTAATITLSQAGDTPPAVTGSASDAPWLSVAPVAVDTSGIGTYSVTIDRSSLADGDYRGTISFSLDAGGAVTVDVLMQVRTASSQVGDTGFLYILLIDPLTSLTIDQTELGATGGVYKYRFNDVASGGYYVVGGSDVDNDGFICDIGETCGSYPVLNDQFVLDITGNRSGIDFISTVISGVTSRATAGHPVEGFRLLPGTDRTRKAVSHR